MSNLVDLLTIGQVAIVSLDSAPTTGGGFAAQIGTFATINNVSSPVGQMYLKTGAGNTGWDQIATGASGVNVGLGSQYAIPIYDTSPNGYHLNPTALQNTSYTVGLVVANSPTRSAAITYTVPNPGDAITAANFILDQGAQTINGAKTFSSAISMSSQQINNMANPTAAQDAATKSYVDAVAQGLSWKTTARAGTTANITLSGTQTIDGIAVVAGDRVLVKNQSTASQNGIYVVASGAWALAADANTGTEYVGAAIFVDQGTLNAGTAWVQITPAPITIGTTSLSWTQFAGAGTYTAGSGLTLTGTQFSVNVDNSTIAITGNNLVVKTGGITDTQVSASAAIQLSKLAALTASTLVVTNGSGYMSSSAGTGFVYATSGTPSYTTTVSLTSQVSGVLPIANGGTNSGTTLNNSRIMVSSGGAIVEAAALTNGQLLIGSTGAAPVAAALTGTANQVIVTNGAGSITLSLPQSINTTNSPSFAGLTLNTFTQGSVLFSGASGLVSQDNAQFFWDDTNHRLGLGTLSPARTLDVAGTTIFRGSQRYVDASATNANWEQFQAQVSTTDATVTTLASVATSSDSLVLIQAQVVGRRTGGTAGANGDAAAYIRTARFKNVGGTLTIQNLQSDYTSEDQPAWNCTLNFTGTTARIQVTGAANNNVNWTCTYTVITLP